MSETPSRVVGFDPGYADPKPFDFMMTGRDLEPGEKAERGDVWLTHTGWQHVPAEAVGYVVSANGHRVRRPIPFRYVPNPEYSELKGVSDGVMGSNQAEPVNTCSEAPVGVTSPAREDEQKNQKNLHSDPDARRWAREFVETAIGMLNRGGNPHAMLRDEDWLHGWFANAMMAMHDHCCRESTKQRRALTESYENREKQFVAQRNALQDQAYSREDRLTQICEILQTGDAVQGVRDIKGGLAQLKAVLLDQANAVTELRTSLADARAVHAHFQAMIAGSLDDAGVPRDHPILITVENAQSMTPQERIGWVKSQYDLSQKTSLANMRNFLTILNELGAARASNQSLGANLERAEQACGKLSLKIADLENRMNSMDGCFLQACADRDTYRQKWTEATTAKK